MESATVKRVQRISSRQNALVHRYKSVASGNEHGLMLLDGIHLITEAMAARVAITDVIVSSEAADRADIRPIMEDIERTGASLVVATAPVMRAVSPVRSASPIVALAARPRAGESLLYRPLPALVLIACGVQEPGNVGAIARVTEAAGATGLVAADACADPFGWKALRGSMGSALRLPIVVDRSIEHAVARARHHGCRILAMVPRDGDGLYDADLTGPTAILVGGEGQGLPPALVDAAERRVTIPMNPPVESLNTAVTAALILYEARRQRAPVAIA
jgi:TrmH family RNA methyltransferase